MKLSDSRSFLALLVAASVTGSAPAAVYIFSGDAIGIPAFGTASPYPSSVVVSGIPLGETVVDVDVAVTNFSHTYPDDAGAVMTNPERDAVVLFNAPGNGTSRSGLTWVFDDSAATELPIVTEPLVSGRFRPSNEYPNDDFDSPAPGGPYASNLAILTNGNPNGTWSLYVQDFASGDSGSIVSWSVRIVTTGAVVPTIGISVSGSNYVISGTNGTPGSTNILLTATNIALPVSNWTPLATNLFDSNGSFVFTNSALPWVPQRFYTLLLP